MTGENASAKLHFFDNGIFIECNELGIGKFINQGDASGLMEVINDIDVSTNNNTVFTLNDNKED